METTKSKQVLDKIRKLLSLANDPSASQGEVENAMKMANTLMQKHQLSGEDVEVSQLDINEEWVDSINNKYDRAAFSHSFLARIAKAYNCRVIGNNDFSKSRVVGDEISRKIVIEMYHQIIPFVRTLSEQRWSEYKKGELDFEFGSNVKISKLNFYKAYFDGYKNGLYEKLKSDPKSFTEEERSKWGLILVKKDALIEEYIQKNIGRITSKKQQGSNLDGAFGLGRTDGKTQNINKRLN